MFGNNFTGKSRDTNFTLARDRVTSRTDNLAAVRAQREARLENIKRQEKAVMIQSLYRGYITRKVLYTSLMSPMSFTIVNNNSSNNNNNNSNNINSRFTIIATPETPQSRLDLYVSGIAAVNIRLKRRNGDGSQHNDGRNCNTLKSLKFYFDLKKWLEKEIFANAIRYYSTGTTNTTATNLSSKTLFYYYTIIKVLSMQCATYRYPDEAKNTINSAMITMDKILLQLHPGRCDTIPASSSPTPTYYLLGETISHLSKYIIVALLQVYADVEGIVSNPSPPPGVSRPTSSRIRIRVDIVMGLLCRTCLIWARWVSVYNTISSSTTIATSSSISEGECSSDTVSLALPRPVPPTLFIAALLAVACSCPSMAKMTAVSASEGHDAVSASEGHDDHTINSCGLSTLMDTVSYFILGNKNLRNSAATDTTRQLSCNHLITSAIAPILVVYTFASFYGLHLEVEAKNDLRVSNSFPFYFATVVLGNKDLCVCFEDSLSTHSAALSAVTVNVHSSNTTGNNNDGVFCFLESLLGLLAGSIHRSLVASCYSKYGHIIDIYEDNNQIMRNSMVSNYWNITKTLLLSPSRTKDFGPYLLRAATTVNAAVSPSYVSCCDTTVEDTIPVRSSESGNVVDNPRDDEVIQQLFSDLSQLLIVASNTNRSNTKGFSGVSMMVSEETESDEQPPGFYNNILSLLGQTVYLCTCNIKKVSMYQQCNIGGNFGTGNREIDCQHVIQAIESAELIDVACSVFILPWLQFVEGTASNSDRRRIAIPMLSKLSNFAIHQNMPMPLGLSIDVHSNAMECVDSKCRDKRRINDKVPLLRVLWEALCALVKFPNIQIKTDTATPNETNGTSSEKILLLPLSTTAPLWSALFSGGSLGNMLRYSNSQGWQRDTLIRYLKKNSNDPTNKLGNKFRAELPFLALTFLNTFNFYVQSSDLAISLRTNTFHLCSSMDNLQPCDHPLLSLIDGLREVVLKSHMIGCDVTDAEIRMSVAYRSTLTATKQPKTKERRDFSAMRPIDIASAVGEEVTSSTLQFIRQTGGQIATVEVAQVAHLLLLRLHIIDESTNYIKLLLRGAKLDTTIENVNKKKLTGVAGKCVSWWSTPLKRLSFPASIGLDQWTELTTLQKADMNQRGTVNNTGATDPSTNAVVVATATLHSDQPALDDNPPLMYSAVDITEDFSDDSDSDGPHTRRGGRRIGMTSSRITSDIHLHSKLLKLRFEHSSRWSLHQRLMTLLQHCPFLVPFSNRVGIFSSLLTESCLRDGLRREYSRSDIVVTRGHIFEDAYYHVRHMSTDTLRSHRLPVRFQRAAHHEDDDDSEENDADNRMEAGYGDGIYREFMLKLCQEGFGSVYGLFKEAHGRDTRDLSSNYGAPSTVIGLYPHPQGALAIGADEEGALDRLHFLGQMVGKALRDGILVDVAFAGFFRNLLLGRQNGLADLPSFDGEMFDSFRKMREMAERYMTTKERSIEKENENTVSEDISDPIEALGLYFTTTIEQLGTVTEIPLIPGGAQLPVTAVNLNAYIHLLVDFRLNREIKKQSNAFRSGLYSMVDLSWLKLFDSVELQVVFRGGNDDDDLTLDITDWRTNTTHRMLGGHDENDALHQLSLRVINDFWHVVEHELTPNQQRLLLKFVTSLSRAPLLGFKHMNPHFCINIINYSNDRLPSAATCMCLLELPCYPNRQVMKEKLLHAIEGTDTFELI